MNILHRKIAIYFDFDQYGTNFSRELIAGLSTYLSLAYIFIVNPSILSSAGVSPAAALFATVVASSLATLAMGIWARLPFAVAPGLEMNSFFAFIAVKSMHMSWQQALGAVFISGLLCLFFTAIEVREKIINSIPDGLKKAIGTSVGVFVATIGLFLAKIVTFGPTGIIDLSSLGASNFTSNGAIILYVGLLISVSLGWKRLNLPGGMLIAIVVCAVLYPILLRQNSTINNVSYKDMLAAFGSVDVIGATHPTFWSAIFVFFIIDFVGGIGKFIGLTSATNIQDENGNVPRLKQALYVDGAGTVLGSILGTSSLIAFVESAVGINAGGRTGLTAIVCGVLMAASIAFAPFLPWIPAAATAGVLVYVGYLLLPAVYDESGERSATNFDISVTIVMSVVTFLTFSLDKSLAIGFWAYCIRSIFSGEDRQRASWMGLIASLLTLAILWQRALA